MITIIEPGPFTTVQDEGRFGWQAFGMPVAGAMDRYACRVANLLAGNRPGAAALEMTLRGDHIRFERASIAAICGADMHPLLNAKPLPNWSSFRADPGDELIMDFATNGCRAYLAVQGGIAVEPLLASRSTYTRAAIGGHEGRILRPGDRLPFGADLETQVIPQALAPKFIPHHQTPVMVRVLPGPQDDHFTREGLETFFNASFTIAPDADRMGYRLDGPAIEHRDAPEIISDALLTGSIQVPGHGRPILLMADHQTAGGYPKIGTVIGPDLSRLAQARPGDAVQFLRCTEAEALDALRRERDTYDQISRSLQREDQLMMRLDVTIAGETFHCEVREG